LLGMNAHAFKDLQLSLYVFSLGHMPWTLD
jgi:hypothetical protein